MLNNPRHAHCTKCRKVAFLKGQETVCNDCQERAHDQRINDIILRSLPPDRNPQRWNRG